MRILIALLALSFLASAESVKSFESRPVAEQSNVIFDFVQKMTTDIGKSNPDLATAIRDWFRRTQAGMPVPEGMRNLSAELSALDDVAKEGKVDLEKIQIEGVIVKVTKDKFPPPKQAAQR